MKILPLFTSLCLVVPLFAAATVGNSGTLFAQTPDTGGTTEEQVPTDEPETTTEIPTDEPETTTEIPTGGLPPEDTPEPIEPGATTGNVPTTETPLPAEPGAFAPNATTNAALNETAPGVNATSETLEIAGPAQQIAPDPTANQQVISNLVEQIRESETNSTQAAQLETAVPTIVNSLSEDVGAGGLAGARWSIEIGCKEKTSPDGTVEKSCAIVIRGGRG